MKDKPLFISSIIFFVLYIIFLTAVFSPLKAALAPFITAGFMVYLLLPAVRFFEKFKISPIISTLTVYALIILFGIFIIIYAAPKIYSAVTQIGNVLAGYMPNIVSDSIGGLLSSGVQGVYTTLLSFLKGGVMFFVGCVAAFYILADMKNITKMAREIIPLQLKGSIKLLADDVKVCMDSFFKGQVIISAILFLMDGVFLYVVNVPYAWGLAFIAAVLDMIPYAGSFVGIGLIVLVTILDDAGKVVIALAGLLAIQQIENNIITPKISSSSLSIHPASTVLVLYVGSFGGFWGLFLAIPAACVLKKIFSRLIQSVIKTI